jgi:FixJ family two-component response regulator
MKVAVIDDDKSARSSLGRLLKSAGIDVVAFSSAREFLDDAQADQIDCAVTDLRMPGVDGIKLQELLAERLPDLAIVFVSGYGDVPTTVRAIRGGAVDFLEKPIDDKALLDAIRRASQRSADQKMSRGEINNLGKRYHLLTSRERDVFKLVTSGLLNKQVATELGITEGTVKVHRARVMSKMNADSLADLVRIADRLHIRTAETTSAKGA